MAWIRSFFKSYEAYLPKPRTSWAGPESTRIPRQRGAPAPQMNGLMLLTGMGGTPWWWSIREVYEYWSYHRLFANLSYRARSHLFISCKWWRVWQYMAWWESRLWRYRASIEWKRRKSIFHLLVYWNGLMKQYKCNANVFDKLLFQQPTHWWYTKDTKPCL